MAPLARRRRAARPSMQKYRHGAQNVRAAAYAICAIQYPRCGAKYSIKCGSAEYAFNACDDADFIYIKPADLKFYSKFYRKNENF